MLFGPNRSDFFILEVVVVVVAGDGAVSIPDLMMLMQLASSENSSSNPSFHDAEPLRLKHSMNMFPPQFDGRSRGVSARLTMAIGPDLAFSWLRLLLRIGAEYLELEVTGPEKS
jgi:hypothetical protein